MHGPTDRAVCRPGKRSATGRYRLHLCFIIHRWDCRSRFHFVNDAAVFQLGQTLFQQGDFLAGRPSARLGSVVPSYQPGVHLTDLATALPDFAITAIREAIPAFDRQIRGFALADAVLTGVETRTSSPLRITRGDDLQSLNVKGLYPAGEGAGYAGGILSAGIDGIRIAEAVALRIGGTNPA